MAPLKQHIDDLDYHSKEGEDSRVKVSQVLKQANVMDLVNKCGDLEQEIKQYLSCELTTPDGADTDSCFVKIHGNK